ncbi:baseplate J/gp47 family protein [Ahrensia sp. R2A130]|uniref:baseplate J/gp47 family protein n=1 Tax=Ahrensia sp. R2A130 TaxID=744979 RepID=UPI0001E0B501|nr:baseplate J/gp47 family protein [Ahrensia sp. R2A130]EFL88271.1 putative bacteriophage protein [Ahrensia sp. R2A130]
MTQPVPTVKAISERFAAVLRQVLPGTDALIHPNTNTVLAKTLGLWGHEMHQRLAYLYRQLFMSTATGAHLERHCGELDIVRKSASRATGIISGSATPLKVYPAGVLFIIDGLQFVSTQGTTADVAGAASFTVRSIDIGSASNRAAGVAAQVASPLEYPGISDDFVVDAGSLGGAADRETDDSLRARGLARKQKPPQGGAVYDYEAFAREVPGVGRAWARRFFNGPGTIGVLFTTDSENGIIPTAGDVAVVQASLDARRQIRREIIVAAPLGYGINTTVSVTPDTPEIRQRVSEAIAAVVVERSEPSWADQPFVFSRSWIAEAISQTVGEERHVLSLPASDITLPAGHIPIAGTVTFV